MERITKEPARMQQKQMSRRTAFAVLGSAATRRGRDGVRRLPDGSNGYLHRWNDSAVDQQRVHRHTHRDHRTVPFAHGYVPK